MEGKELSFTTGREMLSAPLNIFIALRLLVDHSKMTPSREPDAKKLPTCVHGWMEGHGYLFGVCGGVLRVHSTHQKNLSFRNLGVQTSKQGVHKVQKMYCKQFSVYNIEGTLYYT